jgi:hypothetical protein
MSNFLSENARNPDLGALKRGDGEPGETGRAKAKLRCFGKENFQLVL